MRGRCSSSWASRTAGAAAAERRRSHGVRLEKEGTSTFTIEVPEAAAGKWHYTVTPVEVPYPNFPFSLTVGEK